MIDNEEQVRCELRAIAELIKPDSIRPLRIPPPRRRSRTVRWLAPVAAAVAVAGLIAGVTVAGHSADRTAYQRPGNQGIPQGMPKFYVTLDFNFGTTQVVRAVVRNSATGAPISSVQVQRLHLKSSDSGDVPYPLEITGAANDRAFLITLSSGLEILHLAADGHVLGLTHLPKMIYALSGALGPMGTLLSPDGTEAVVGGTNGIVTYSVTTGVTRKWLLPRGDDNTVLPLNWQGTGQVFLSMSVASSVGPYRLLDVAGPGGSLLADSRSIPAPGDATISRMIHSGWEPEAVGFLAGGKTMLRAYLWSSAVHDGKYTAEGRVLETSVSTGRLLRVLNIFTAQVPYDFPGTHLVDSRYCYPLSFGPSDVHVLMSCINSFGRLDGSHFTPLPKLSTTAGPLDPGIWPAAW